MNVSELVEILKHVDGDTIVTYNPDVGGYFPISTVEVKRLYLEPKCGIYNPYTPEKEGSVIVLCIG